MRLTVGSRSYDLRTRALVMAVAGSTGDLVDQGADLVEVVDPAQPAPAPACVVASDDDMVRRALSAGVALLRLPQPTPASLAMCAEAGAAVLVAGGAAAAAAAAGLPPERIALDSLLLDVTGEQCPGAATAVGVIGGARIVRTADVAGARRICDVLAAVLESP
ncbi:MAG: hypothetical protein ACR2KK_23525 [Acidimicrobiales bacterium]